MKNLATFLALFLLLSPFVSNGQCTASAGATNATSCVCPAGGGTNCDLIPDITIARLPLTQASNYTEYAQVCNPPCDGNDGRLRLGVSTPIIGYGPLETRGTTLYVCGTDTTDADSLSGIPQTCPNSGLPPKQLIKQRVFHKNGNVMSYTDRDAGSMTYHASHGHQHVDDWGIYTLRTNNGDPNPLNWPIIGQGSKLGFCLLDIGSCNANNGYCVDANGTTMTSANTPNYGLGGGNYGCSNTVQGISNGYMDTYSQSLDGMWINLPAGLCNGTYYVVIQIDPYNYFLETNENNNVMAVPITLTKQGGSVPTISTSGPTSFCAGGSVTLTSSFAPNYVWSNGATTQSIAVNSSGTYTVSVTISSCPTASATASVNAINVSAPSTTGAAVCDQGSTILSANGSGTINWYLASSGGGSIASGPSYTTPTVTTSTTYYAESSVTTAGSNVYCPPSSNAIGGGGAYTGNQYLTFDASSACTLASVKLYATSAGSITIQLQNSSGTTINSATVSVPAGESRAILNFPITAGSNYRLTRSGAFSLYRNNGGVSYPYSVNNGLISITGSSGGSSFYYFFYDWQITTPAITCYSNRTPATITVNATPIVTANASPAVICPGASSTLTANGASTYNWSPNTGLSGTSGSSVTATPATTTTYTVTGTSNGCTGSKDVTLEVSAGPAPAQPGAMSGTAAICPSINAVGYSVAPVATATSYTWTVPNGATIASGAGTNAITVNFSGTFSGGYIYVRANNNCGNSPWRKKNIISTLPATPSAISGQVMGICNATVAYSIPLVTNATLYTWTPPIGANILSGQGTNGVTLSFTSGFSQGSLCVTAGNSCGTSVSRCVSLNAKPKKPASITGPASVCANQTGIQYSTTSVPGASSYVWTVPAGASIASGGGTTSITVNFGATAGNVSVKSKNSCGASNKLNKAVTINCKLPEGNTADFTHLNVVPNPAKDLVELHFTSEAAGDGIIIVSDVMGREVMKEIITLNKGENTHNLDLKNISKGVYVISLDNDNKRVSKKLIVN